MRKWFVGVLLSVALLFGVAQGFGQRVLTEADSKDGVYLVFDRGDGASTYYRLTGAFKVVTDASTTATQFITSGGLQFNGYGRTQGLTHDLYSLIPKPVEEQKPDVGQPQPPVFQNDDWLKGGFKALYGSNYVRERDELTGGDANFKFYGQGGVSYPAYGSTDKPSTDALVVLALPTHSIVNYAGLDFVSAIEMRLTDQSGNTVWELKDTKGGYHPALRLNARGNNHPDDANRWVKYGHYKLWVKNLSSDGRAVQTITFGTTKGGERINQKLWPGYEETFDLNIDRLGDEWDMYKINCNVFTGPGQR